MSTATKTADTIEKDQKMTKLSLEIIAGEFVALHNEKIIKWHELSGDDDLEFFFRATESDPGEDNGMGELVYEISGDDSHTGNPILFEVPASVSVTTKLHEKEI